jgi:hypothetical protein
MAFLLYLLLHAPQATAQSTFELIDGESLLAECAGSEACGDWTMDGLEDLLTTQAFTLQHLPAGSSAIRSTSSGPLFEWGADLLLQRAPPTGIPRPFPVAPRLAVGVVKPHEVSEGRTTRTGLGAYLVPPLKVAHTGIFSAGVNISFNQSADASPVGFGAILAYSLTRVSGPFVGSPEGLANMGALPPDADLNEYMPTCAEDPCLDRLLMHSLAPALGLSLDVHRTVSGHLQVGAAWFQHEITLGFEESRWQQIGAHPQWQAGISLRPAPVAQLSVAYGSLWRTGVRAEDRAPFINKIQIAVSHHWAARRAEQEEETTPEATADHPIR